MDIRKLNHLHHRFVVLKAWYFLLPAIIFSLLAVQGLRSNYQTMTKLRDAVYTADKDNTDIEKPLNDLRGYVYGHMNTNLASGSSAIRPPIQLKERYNRLIASEQARVKATNAGISTQGEVICGQQFPAGGFNAPRVACIQDYLAVNGIKARSIPDQLYKFDFISPRWSPDLAGFSILLSTVFFILFLARVILERYIRRRLR